MDDEKHRDHGREDFSMNIARRSAIVSLLAAASLLVSACKSSEPAPEQGAAPVTVRAAEVTGGQTEGVSLRFLRYNQQRNSLLVYFLN